MAKNSGSRPVGEKAAGCGRSSHHDHVANKRGRLRIDPYGRIFPHRERTLRLPTHYSTAELLALVTLVAINMILVKLCVDQPSVAAIVFTAIMTVVWFVATHRRLDGLEQQIRSRKGQLGWCFARSLPTLGLMTLWILTAFIAPSRDKPDPTLLDWLDRLPGVRIDFIK